ncbi:serine protease [Agarivorans aestuarii]|uniref:Serine protease n=1 Tax=Agarivorans aestuarii TaxID=1563703 RepID=A0ABU7G849_9ALTE|nr:serine protease [Agarivorans aestuarii]MEE1675577.1 serine protease [Agarivorans aestuarii]
MKNTKVWLVVLSFLLSFSASLKAESEVVPFIVGGNDAPTNYPWMAQVFLGTSRCGGVLIGEHWVLTAAHCTYDASRLDRTIAASQVTVLLGNYQFANSSHPDTLQVSEVYQHPNYVSPSDSGPAYDYDVSLLRLAEPQSITPVILNANKVTDALNVGGFMSVVGFGRTNTDPLNPIYPDVLQQGNLSLMSESRCEDEWSASSITEQMFCAYGTNQDACSGDSGGPVFIEEQEQHRLLGLVSWGNLSCQGSAGVYADIGTVCTWISDIASIAGDSSLVCSIADTPSSSGGGASWWLLILSFPLLLIRRLSKAQSFQR